MEEATTINHQNTREAKNKAGLLKPTMLETRLEDRVLAQRHDSSSLFYVCGTLTCGSSQAVRFCVRKSSFWRRVRKVPGTQVEVRPHAVFSSTKARRLACMGCVLERAGSRPFLCTGLELPLARQLLVLVSEVQTSRELQSTPLAYRVGVYLREPGSRPLRLPSSLESVGKIPLGPRQRKPTPRIFRVDDKIPVIGVQLSY